MSVEVEDKQRIKPFEDCCRPHGTTMLWLKSFNDVEYALVYVSNGNNPAGFYERYGFKFSHDVLNGFIKCYSANISS